MEVLGRGKRRVSVGAVAPVPNPTDEVNHAEVDPADTVAVVNEDVKTEKKEVADGDYELPVPVGLDRVYANPEFSRAADSLVEAIKHHMVVVKGENYDKNKAMDIATKILESRA